MRGDIPPHLQYAFMVWCFDKHRDNFTFFSLMFTFESETCIVGIKDINIWMLSMENPQRFLGVKNNTMQQLNKKRERITVEEY
jgi:hypothetical protein